jgi:Restriction endonuclease S subunits
MRTFLRDLVDIRVGYSFRSKIENEQDGDVRVLQIGDVKSGVEIVPSMLPAVRWTATSEAPLLVPGDVVLPSRGDRYEAVLIQTNEPMVASGQLFVLKPDSHRVTSDYLCWFLNQPQSKSYMLKHRAGSSIPSLSRPALGELSVFVPALQRQKKIIELAQLWRQEQILSQQLLANRQKMLDGIFSKLLES